jgi:AcrR family transcriptional regulator
VNDKAVTAKTVNDKAVTGKSVLAREPARPRYDVSTVLEACVAVFNEQGYDGTSMEDLSRRLGISKSSIYHHIESKEAILGLALDRALAGLEEAAAGVRALDGPAVARLETLLQTSVQVLVDRLPYVTLLLRVRGNSDVERQAMGRRRQIDHLVAELVAEAMNDGDLRPDTDPAIVARLLFGMVNSLTEWLRPRGGQPADELARTLTTLAFDGLRPRG